MTDEQRIPGEVSPRNTLNELGSKEWISETVSVWRQRGLGRGHPDTAIERQHPAPFSFTDVSRLVHISRGTETIQVYATLGSTEFAIETEEGIRTEHCDRTFLVTATDYVFGGRVVEPRKGDVVVDTAEAAAGQSTFEINHPAGDRPFEYDRHGALLRIFTKRIKREVAAS